jgi:hypothetical protein
VYILFLILSFSNFFSLYRLGDALSSLSAKKEPVLSGNSKITQILSDSLGNFLYGLLFNYLLLFISFPVDCSWQWANSLHLLFWCFHTSQTTLYLKLSTKY